MRDVRAACTGRSFFSGPFRPLDSGLRGNDYPHGVNRNAANHHSRGSGNDSIDVAVVDAPTVIPAEAGIQ